MKSLRPLLIAAIALPTMAAGPEPRRLTLEVPAQPARSLPVTATPIRPAQPRPVFLPAPTPNRDVESPLGPRADTATSVSPSLFNRTDTYRGEGFGRNSSATIEQERRVKPGAGVNFTMPFAPN